MKSLNPFHYLAGRIFIWFWLVLLSAVISAVMLSRSLTEPTEIRRLPHNIASQLQHQVDRYQQLSDSKALIRQLQQQQPDRWLVVNTTTNHISSDSALPADFDQNWLTELSQLARPGWLKHRNITVAGPFLLQLGDESLALYQKRQRRARPWWHINDAPQHIVLIFTLFISAVASFILAISISRPLRELLQRNLEFANGQLDVRVKHLIKRKDELGQLGHSFNTMAERISALLTNQQRLLRDISHELRSPLARAQLALGLTERQQDLQQMPRIKQELDRLDAMLDELLTYSKLDAGQYQLQKHTFDLTELIAEIIAVNQVESDAKQQQVLLQAEPNIEVEADSQMLGRAIENVLRNAIKYSPTASTVSCQLKRLGNDIQLQITDQGPGIEAHLLTAIFEPFYRVSDSRTSNTGGTGLGLAIVAKIIRQHGGTVLASKISETGLCITIQIPVN
ncbi:ATP-binding protein [Rheinheimera salexigens]|uniref:histidine kinase n=1 Tax=Rheinheimera salexigens TaxID=1628148 RepID=A0A1E7Q4H2_9GAMM|nr:ATP-binding protein [Rheinheimera salexigens]OEY68973.1 two-component sensor histidine kinase [Rheinheimera salexigens]